MNTDSVTFIFFNSVLANNFVLAMFLGLCPFLGVSGKLNTAVPMGLATTFVMLVSSICAYFLNELLVAFNIEYLRLISYIVVIASSVQLVEMAMKKLSPALFRALGIFLPLITTNCAVLGVALSLIHIFKHGSKKNAWEVDAISGATISSRAIAKGLNGSAQEVLPKIVPLLSTIEGAKP